MLVVGVVCPTAISQEMTAWAGVFQPPLPPAHFGQLACHATSKLEVWGQLGNSEVGKGNLKSIDFKFTTPPPRGKKTTSEFHEVCSRDRNLILELPKFGGKV